MARVISYFLCLLVVFLCNSAGKSVLGTREYQYTRHDFPVGFTFGSGTSAYQVEGAANEDGRTPSIFDTFAHAETSHGGNGDVASDGYHKYKEDVQLMVDTGLDAYRFSISWPRLIPNGRGPVNPKGLEYYNNLIDELVGQGIQPHVTLVHLDTPQALEDEYGGFISQRIVVDFLAYAEVCFREFGDRVKHWTTINEGNIFVMGGYDTGDCPPQRCSAPFAANCHKGNSTTEPYIAAHNLLLAHAAAARLYKQKYQVNQQGYIGFSLYAFGFVPSTSSYEDLIASQRFADFFIGWFMHPLMLGDYPEIMKRRVGKRMPTFNGDESKLVKGSFDFIGINHYSTLYIKDNPSSLKMELRDYIADIAARLIFNSDDAPPGGFPITSWGLEGVLKYFKETYGNPPIYIHENGQRTDRLTTLNDTSRAQYLQAFIGGVLEAIRNGSDVKGYFSWSFLDVFELLDGYQSRYGLYYVDFEDPKLTRYPKLSQRWYSAFLKGKTIPLDALIQSSNYAASLSRGRSNQ